MEQNPQRQQCFTLTPPSSIACYDCDFVLAYLIDRQTVIILTVQCAVHVYLSSLFSPLPFLHHKSIPLNPKSKSLDTDTFFQHIANKIIDEMPSHPPTDTQSEVNGFVDVESGAHPRRVDLRPKPSAMTEFLRKRTVRVVLILVLIVPGCVIVAGGTTYGLHKVDKRSVAASPSTETTAPMPSNWIQAGSSLPTHFTPTGKAHLLMGRIPGHLNPTPSPQVELPAPPPAASPAPEPIDPDALRELFFYPRPGKVRDVHRLVSPPLSELATVETKSSNMMTTFDWPRAESQSLKLVQTETDTPASSPTGEPIDPDALQEFYYPRPW
ncbi:hypothetical protein FB567DRAFT_186752 [Paraphoma chrysanthemicola]|uniref:Transmembrane protein n=1 Tax=Paraphoma chrysanthemicola TaxID=798071 RepID=A0A8K0QX56_9PLEO|nr:hypothetical protein FB567DRAFT_186752 [Paraphoma chrysanthemicola]